MKTVEAKTEINFFTQLAGTLPQPLKPEEMTVARFSTLYKIGRTRAIKALKDQVLLGNLVEEERIDSNGHHCVAYVVKSDNKEKTNE